MRVKIEKLAKQLAEQVADDVQIVQAKHEITLEVPQAKLHALCMTLRESPFDFDVLIDICGVDYLDYGVTEWETDSSSATGFERGVQVGERPASDKPRFAVVYHLLSTIHNQRIRLRARLANEPPRIVSVIDIWAAANWFEREAFDFFGILFDGHLDLRRILTDYGFIGHPFRKDFPVHGQVEMRYDAKLRRVIYAPVDIEPRTLVPKVIREDNRYQRQTTAGEPKNA